MNQKWKGGDDSYLDEKNIGSLDKLPSMFICEEGAKGTRTQSYYQYKIDTYDGDVNILLDLLEFFIQ